MKRVISIAIRFALAWGLQAAGLLVVHWVVPGVRLEADGAAGLAAEAMSVALVLAVLNTSIRPALLWLTLPVNVFSLGFFTLLINALMLQMVSWVLPFLIVAQFGWALAGSLVLAAFNSLVGGVAAIDSHYSFFDGVVEWLARRMRPAATDEGGRGLLILEIDGLSHARLERALERGIMPFLRSLLDSGYRLSAYDCGLPSQTSSSQAGIMFGRNEDIPGFRWYDKRARRVVSSRNPSDARDIEALVAHERGLLRGGSSINNNLSGGAAKTVLTASRGFDTRPPEQQHGMDDLYLFFLNPYLFPRSLVMAVIDMAREVVQHVRRRLRREWPRLDALVSRFPAERAACTVLLRDVGTFVAIMDMLRGLPAIYVTYMGYDEVAHHAGPDSRDALAVLRGIDAQFRRLHAVLTRRAPRPYELFVLSDHGQAGGATFRQRYGMTLADLIDNLLLTTERAVQPAQAELERRPGGELAREIEGVERRLAAEGRRTTTLARTRRVLEQEVAPPSLDLSSADVVVCASGNLAHVYFTAREGFVSVTELQAARPGLLQALLRHPGIGCVVGRDEEGRIWAFGAEGDRCLDDGLVLGEDPLAAYGPGELRASQLRRLAQCATSGDLMVFSSVYEDGTVASFEELIGCHGGMGGGQTEAFILHPEDVEVSGVVNASELYPVLEGRRGLPAPPPAAPAAAIAAAGAFRPSALLAGVHRIRVWGSLLLRSLLLDRSAYEELAARADLNGPALLVGLGVTAAAGLRDALGSTPVGAVPGGIWGAVAMGLLQGGLGWMLLIGLGAITGRVLAGSRSLSASLRALGFAQAPLLFVPLEAISGVGQAIAVVLLLWCLLAWWVAVRAVFGLRRLAAAVVPVVAAGVLVVAVVLASAMAGGVRLTVLTVLERLGLQ